MRVGDPTRATIRSHCFKNEFKLRKSSEKCGNILGSSTRMEGPTGSLKWGFSQSCSLLNR